MFVKSSSQSSGFAENSCASRTSSPVASASSRSIGYVTSTGARSSSFTAYPRVILAPRESQRNEACMASCIGTTTASMARSRIR